MPHATARGRGAVASGEVQDPRLRIRTLVTVVGKAAVEERVHECASPVRRQIVPIRRGESEISLVPAAPELST